MYEIVKTIPKVDKREDDASRDAKDIRETKRKEDFRVALMKRLREDGKFWKRTECETRAIELIFFNFQI